MKTNYFFKKLSMVLSFVLISLLGFGQSITSTFSTGDISTEYSNSVSTATTSACADTLNVILPTGVVITGVDVAYSMTAASGAYMSEQRSFIRCITTGGTVESAVYTGTGTTIGTMTYSRTGLSIANAITGGGLIQFEMNAFRTWGGSACDASYNVVDNNTWSITVNYYVPGPLDASIAELIIPAYAGTSDVKAVIKNFGTTTLTSATVNWTIDGGALTAYSWTGSLAQYAVDTVTIVNYSFTPGNHAIIASSTSPNGGTDGNTTNDTATFTEMFVGVISNFPFAEDFANGDSYWPLASASNSNAIVDTIAGNPGACILMTGGTSSSWSNYTTVAGAFGNTSHVSTATATIDASTLTNVRFEFDMRQAYTYNTTYGWARVLINGTDYAKDLKGDSTWNAVSGNADPFQKLTFDLSAYAGTIFSVSIELAAKYDAFNYSNTYGDDLYIDNIKVYQPVANDLAMSALIGPTSGFEMNNDMDIKVVVYNNGTASQSGYDISYSIDGGTTFTTQTFASAIASGDYDTLSFTASADLSTVGIYNVILAVANTGDADATNDTILTVIENRTLPYNEGFDSYGNADNPSDWSILNTTGIPNAYGYVSTYNGYNSYNCYRMNNYNAISGDLIAVLPGVYSGLANKAIKFWLNGSNSGDFIVGVMTDPNDASTFVSVDTVNQMGSVYTQVAISFSSYTGSAKYVAFKHGMSGTYKSFYVDDIELYEPLPNEMMMLSWDAPMSSIDYASGDVVVSVYNNGIAAQSSIPVAYSTDGGTTIVYDIITATVYPGDTLQFTFATPAVFASGLHECGAVVNNGDAVPENDTAFYTMVNHSMPFYDDFENYSEDQIDLGIPNGYAGLNTLSSTSADVSLFYADYNAYSGSNSMRIYNSSTTSGVLLFTIPYYGGTSLVDKWLTFWHKGYSNVDLIIGVMDAYDDTASFVAMDTIRPVDSEYYKYAVLLSPYAGTGKYIAFKHGLNSTYKSLYIDDIRFEIAPTSSVLHISADSLVFRGARLGIDTSIQKYIIENKGVGQIIVSAPSVGGTNAFSFVIIDTNTYPKSLGMLESLEVTIGLSDSQVGEKEAFVHFSSDGVSDTIQLMGEVVDSIIQTFPFVENFNSGLLDMGWRIDAVSYEGNGDYVWLFNQGSTPRLYTGPSHDLSGNGNYLFVDAQLGYSDSYGADETTLSTIQIDFSTLSEPRLNFWYHMYGADVHVLKVFVFQNGSYSLVQSIIGEQQTSSADDWLMSSIDLSSYSGIIDSITFQTIYDGPLGDVAIDNIAFGENMLIDLGADTAVCSTAITSVVLDAGSGNSPWKYRWKELSSSNILDTLQTYTVVSPGTYIVEAMDDGYFFGSDTIVVLFNSYPTVAMSDTVLCRGDTATLLAGNLSYTYLWSTGETSSAISVSPNQNTTYTVVVSNGNCQEMDTVVVVVNALPNISFSGLDNFYCTNVDSDTLSASPSNGIFSGNGITGSIFNPMLAGAGSHIIAYSYTDANMCTSVIHDTTNVETSPIIAVSSDTAICSGDTALLSASVTSGGTNISYLWSQGESTQSIFVSPSQNTTYTVLVSNVNCQVMDTVVVDVNALPNISFSGLDTFYCANDQADILTPSPTNGTFSGNGIIGSSFYPTTAGLGTHVITYSYTDANQCAAQVYDSTTVGPVPTLVITSDTTICFGDTVVLTASNTSSGSLDTYLWSTGATSNSITIMPLVSTNYSVRLDNGGCQVSDTIIVTVNLLPVVSFTGLASVYSVYDPQVSLYGSPSNGVFSGSGISANEFYPNIAGPGNHTIAYSYTDANQCSASENSITKVLNPPTFVATPVSFTSPPFNVMINNTSSTSYHKWLWNFGDGGISDVKNPTHTYLYNGNYSITLLAVDTINQKVDTVSQIITCTGGIVDPCNIVSELTQPQSFAMICEGDSVRLSATQHSNIIYAWTHNGAVVPDATDSVFYAKLPGFYMAVLTDNVCSKVTTNYFVLANHPIVAPTIATIGNIAPCSNDSLKLEASSGFSSYLWNNGKAGSYIYVNSSDYYSVSAINNYSCRVSSPVTIINASMAQIPKICAVSTLSNANHNIIQWLPESTLVVDSFRVYRETSISNKYDYIGGVAYIDPSEFEDVQSNTAVRQYRYKITAIDTCGLESPTSMGHKTLHLQVNAAIGGHWNLIWQAYEGFSFGSYNIYRGTDSLNMSLLTTVSSSINAFTDLNNPAGDIYYQLEVVSTTACQAKSYGISVSNIFNTKYSTGVGINVVSSRGASISIYPNPNKGQFTLIIQANFNHTRKYQLEIYSTIGQIVFSDNIEFNGSIKIPMHLEGLSKGVYIVRLRSKAEVLNSRFIID